MIKVLRWWVIGSFFAVVGVLFLGAGAMLVKSVIVGGWPAALALVVAAGLSLGIVLGPALFDDERG
jgi:uncharacterized membrane protein YhiD involved in acid resistance